MKTDINFKIKMEMDDILSASSMNDVIYIGLREKLYRELDGGLKLKLFMMLGESVSNDLKIK